MVVYDTTFIEGAWDGNDLLSEKSYLMNKEIIGKYTLYSQALKHY